MKADLGPWVGSVANNGGRSTLQLAWTCLVPIGLCTWTVQRPNVVPFTKQRIPALARKRLFWMMLTVLRPEYVTYVAIDQWQNARKYKEVQKLGNPDFTINQGPYAAMECLVVRMYNDVSVGAGEKYDSTERGISRDQKNYMDDLIILVREKILESPRISLHSLEERSKMDTFFSIHHHRPRRNIHYFNQWPPSQRPPISFLEVGIFALVFCAAFIELFWWNKPLDLRTSTVIDVIIERASKFRKKSEDLPLYPSGQSLGDLSEYSLY